MFDQLFQSPEAVSRHSKAPYAEERRRYLAACAQQGDSHSTLLFMAQDLFWVADKLSIYSGLKHVTVEQVRAVANDWRKRQRACSRVLNKVSTRQRYLRIAVSWLRFLGHLRAPAEPIPFEPRLREYCRWATEERGFSEATVKQWHSQVRHFLRGTVLSNATSQTCKSTMSMPTWLTAARTVGVALP